MVKVVARDSAGAELASTRVVLPVSDEMSCQSCHARQRRRRAPRAPGGSTIPIPKRIGKEHPAPARREVPGCDRHCRDAIQLHRWRPARHREWGNRCCAPHAISPTPWRHPPSRESNRSPKPVHSQHATVKDPASGLALNDLSNRDSCYMCHPGSQTKCLRGAMGDARNPDGSNAMDCQSCHGNMAMVGAVGRQGWLDQPNCQSCHDKDAVTGSFVRHLSVFDASGARDRCATSASRPTPTSRWRASRCIASARVTAICSARPAMARHMPSIRVRMPTTTCRVSNCRATPVPSRNVPCATAAFPTPATVARMGFTPSARPGWGATATQPNRARERLQVLPRERLSRQCPVAHQHGPQLQGGRQDPQLRGRRQGRLLRLPQRTPWRRLRQVRPLGGSLTTA